MKRLSKHRYRKLTRYLSPPLPTVVQLLHDFPTDLWDSFNQRANDLGISLFDFLLREYRIDQVRAAQLASLDPEVAVSGGQTSKPGPQRIERIFSRLK